jgi:hypothetical protein
MILATSHYLLLSDVCVVMLVNDFCNLKLTTKVTNWKQQSPSWDADSGSAT